MEKSTGESTEEITEEIKIWSEQLSEKLAKRNVKESHLSNQQMATCQINRWRRVESTCRIMN